MTAAPPDYTRKDKRSVAIFGWSRTVENTPQWHQAEEVGRLAAQNGFTVLTGGYCGSMEAVSKGAREVRDAAPPGSLTASVEVVGVIVTGIFPDRRLQGNRYLTETRDSTSMMNRIEQLTTNSRYFIILPGTAGTLQELTTIWVQSVIHPNGHDRPVIIAFREPWEKCVAGIAESLALPAAQGQLIHFVDTPEEAVELMVKDAKGELDSCL